MCPLTARIVHLGKDRAGINCHERDLIMKVSADVPSAINLRIVEASGRKFISCRSNLRRRRCSGSKLLRVTIGYIFGVLDGLL